MASREPGLPPQRIPRDQDHGAALARLGYQGGLKWRATGRGAQVLPRSRRLAWRPSGEAPLRRQSTPRSRDPARARTARRSPSWTLSKRCSI